MKTEEKAKITMELAKENDNRWIGKAHYSCLTCSHSMSTENNELMCVLHSIHKKVNEEELCREWN